MFFDNKLIVQDEIKTFAESDQNKAIHNQTTTVFFSSKKKEKKHGNFKRTVFFYFFRCLQLYNNGSIYKIVFCYFNTMAPIGSCQISSISDQKYSSYRFSLTHILIIAANGVFDFWGHQN